MQQGPVLDIGAHCSIPSCNVNDFLPIRCKCDQLFCRDHILADIHNCPVLQNTPSTSSFANKLQRCAVQGCSKPSLEAYVSNSTTAAAGERSPAVCTRCQHAFCASHRHPTSHACSVEDPSSSAGTKNATARAVLAKQFPGSSSGEPRVTASNTIGAAKGKNKAVEAMKLRLHAQPGDPRDKHKDSSVPRDQRLHVKVGVGSSSSDERALWFRKNIGGGRALDLMAAHFQMTSTDESPLRLMHVPSADLESTVVLRLDEPLCQQVDDGAHLLIIR